jgi:formamidopyrimidine-DNA glycosylase
MPELPEVETVRRDIHDRILGRTVTNVVLGRLRTLRRYADPQEFVDELVGATVTGTGRLGKYLFIDFGPSTRLVIHLRMSGQLLWCDSYDTPLLKHTHVRIQFESGEELRFIDPRTFGEMFVVDPNGSVLSHIGPDAWNAVDTPKQLTERIGPKRAAVKGVLLDQSVVSGVGSIYADEICFRAKVRPGRSAATLRPIDIKRLHEAMKAVLGEAIEARGSTLGDGQYVGADGQPGTFALSHRVHARKDRPCLACGKPIVSGIVAQRSAYWCTRCQR